MIFAKVCSKCNHVHNNNLRVWGKFPICGKGIGEGPFLSMCACEGENTLDCWIEKENK